MIVALKGINKFLSTTKDFKHELFYKDVKNLFEKGHSPLPLLFVEVFLLHNTFSYHKTLLKKNYSDFCSSLAFCLLNIENSSVFNVSILFSSLLLLNIKTHIVAIVGRKGSI